MRKIVFPPVEDATDDGLVAIGGDLEVDTLQTAYRQGIFPWPISVELPLAWFSPDPRGILQFTNFHLSKSFQKFIKHHPYKVTFNQAFSQVIRECAHVARKNQPGTWITPDLITGYEKLFQANKAYSVEVWENDELCAGLYGVIMGEFCSGESMFTKVDNGSKLALYGLVRQLESAGLNWLDTQMITPVVESFGGVYIDRMDFISLLSSLDWSKKRSQIFGN
jgi:leucyl/phenylalanyl-tRNA--protein transferase